MGASKTQKRKRRQRVDVPDPYRIRYISHRTLVMQHPDTGHRLEPMVWYYSPGSLASYFELLSAGYEVIEVRGSGYIYTHGPSAVGIRNLLKMRRKIWFEAKYAQQN